MRPVARSQSAFRTPLNAILGTEAHVRLLRVLSAASPPLAPSEIAEEARLNLSGVVRALSALEETGVVTRLGGSQRQLLAFNRDHPLAPAIGALFGAERQRV